MVEQEGEEVERMVGNIKQVVGEAKAEEQPAAVMEKEVEPIVDPNEVVTKQELKLFKRDIEDKLDGFLTTLKKAKAQGKAFIDEEAKLKGKPLDEIYPGILPQHRIDNKE